MARYFVHNLEEDRLHIHTGGKSDWLTIPENDRNEIKRGCLWSKARNCWLSRSKGAKAKIYLGDALKRAGFEDRGEEGEKLSYAEQVEAKQEKAEARADRMENRAEKAETLGNRLHETAHQMASAIPFGQPILVGHHSERRDRNYRDRIHNTFGKAFNELDKAKHYEDRAATARQTAEGAQFSNPTYLGKRIAEAETEERLVQRRLEGKFYEHSEPKTISDAYRDQLNEWLAEIQDKAGIPPALPGDVRGEDLHAGIAQEHEGSPYSPVVAGDRQAEPEDRLRAEHLLSDAGEPAQMGLEVPVLRGQGRKVNPLPAPSI